MLKKFKVGDRVKCIRQEYGGRGTQNLKPNFQQVYTISGYNNSYPILAEFENKIININGYDSNYWDDDCFELVEKIKEFDEPLFYEK